MAGNQGEQLLRLVAIRRVHLRPGHRNGGTASRLVVAPFELERFRDVEFFLADFVRRDLERFYGRSLHSAGATVDDLAALCREDGLDYVILPP